MTTDCSARHADLARHLICLISMVWLTHLSAASGHETFTGIGPQSIALQTGEITSDSIRDAANRVMQQHDYRSVRRRVLENMPDSDSNSGDGFLVRTLSRMAESVGDFFEWIFSGLFRPRNTRPGPVNTPPTSSSPPPSSSGGLNLSVGTLFLYLGLALLVIATIWIIATVIKKRDGRREMDSSGLFDDTEGITDLTAPPGELAASTYESRAIQMGKEGNYRAAVRELLIGSMSWIERAGLIRFRKGLTNRDYIRAVWRQEDRRSAYGQTAIEFEKIYFGRRTATKEAFEECLRSFQGSFREEETATTAS